MGKYISFYKVAVEEDMSQWILEEWIKAGFRELEWEYAYEEWKDTKKWREQGSVCPTCFALDGNRFKIQEVLDKTTHNAPKYSMSHVGCYCRMKRVAREDERLDYPEDMQKTIEQKLDEVGFTVVHVEESIRDLFQRQGVQFDENDIQNVKQKVLDYAQGLSMKNKSTARDQIWRAIQRETWAITHERKGASLFGFIRVANQVKKELKEVLPW